MQLWSSFCFMAPQPTPSGTHQAADSGGLYSCSWSGSGITPFGTASLKTRAMLVRETRWSLGELAEAHSPITIAGSLAIDVRFAADRPSFELRAPHPGADTLDDQVAFEFCDGADDDDEARPSGPPVSIFSRS